LKRYGTLKLGDKPVALLKVILLEGEQYWQVRWQLPEGAQGGLKYILEDSFERQRILMDWNTSKFNELKGAYIYTKNNIN
jgi:hypothetical protein